MKNVFKVLVLSFVASSLVACSSAKKEDDSILADLPQSESSIESETVSQDTSSLIDPVEESAPASSMLEDNSSLGTGSSGLGH